MARFVGNRSISLLVALWHVSACDSGGVGDPCVPEEEYLSDFSGFSLEEVNLESGSLSCETRLCLVNHFQGRVSCPGGQSEEDLALSPSDPRRCHLPSSGPPAGRPPRTMGSSGEESLVTVGVPAWDAERPAEDAVYCSCRCDGPDQGARYCECPEGFRCERLVDNFGLPRQELVGSYCVREGTSYAPR